MRKDNSNTAHPIIRFRSMVTGVALLLLVISGPLFTVWKQVYINETSLKLNAMSDSIIVLEKKIAALKFSTERLSSTERIEKLAREQLQFEYPSSNQIVIVRIPTDHPKSWLESPRDIFAFLRKTITKEQG